MEYHGNLLCKLDSRLSLLEEQYSDINDNVEMLVTEARRTRQLLERCTDSLLCEQRNDTDLTNNNFKNKQDSKNKNDEPSNI